MFEQIIGQTAAKKILRQALAKGRVSHAYLFYGPAGTGKKFAALSFAKAYFCEGEQRPCGTCLSCRKIEHGNFADLRIVEPEGASLKIEQFRRIQKEIYLRPVEGKGRIYVIDEAEKMTLAAANSFLKLLEEPLSEVCFILIAHNLHALLPTVVSRCQLVPFVPYSRDELAVYLQKQYGKERDEAVFLAGLAAGSLRKADELGSGGEFLNSREEMFELWQRIESGNFSLWEMAEKFESKKEKIDEIFELFISWYRDALLYNQTREHKLLVNLDKVKKIAQIGQKYAWRELERKLRLLEESRSRLAQNANFRLEIEYLLLNLCHR